MSTAEEGWHRAPQESKKECEWCRESIRIEALSNVTRLPDEVGAKDIQERHQ